MAILILLCHPPLHDGLHNSTPNLLLNDKGMFLIIAFTVNAELNPTTSLQPWTHFRNFLCCPEAPEKATPIPSEVMISVQQIVGSYLEI